MDLFLEMHWCIKVKINIFLSSFLTSSLWDTVCILQSTRFNTIHRSYTAENVDERAKRLREFSFVQYTARNRARVKVVPSEGGRRRRRRKRKERSSDGGGGWR